ncbi:unnamed protein product [Mytilus coruscus]|uniref:Uncharacterized protein n=1 Tax=Mytilus coruscus TaxID=42192 RepID=A0A6J8CXR1_MYTCO|nr:unnamed protein product [Mytilus coruscus]
MVDLVNEDKQSKFDKFINTTLKSSAKRDQPASSPDLSSPSSQQQKKSWINLSPKIIEIVDDRIQPYIDTITQNKDALILQEAELKKQSDEIKSLKSKLVKVESRIEEHEQYSRRTSLRFHNVPVPTDDNGAIITPIDTDDLVLRICNKKLKVKLNIFDIGRSHPIGEMKDGKISIIVRFLSYRQRNMVFSNKKKLKNNLDKIFIAENLTKHRYDLIKQTKYSAYQRKDTFILDT